MYKPKTIFKYQNTSLNSILNLKKHALYMASPTLFNDPYDCSINFQLSELSENQIEKLRVKYSNRSTESKEIFKQQNNEELKIIFESSARKTLITTIDNFLKNYGVCCFTEANDDLLMWGHYSDSFKGFCLEFRTEFEPFSKLQQVNYKIDFPKIDTFNLLDKENKTIVKDLYCTKSKKWKYEIE